MDITHVLIQHKNGKYLLVRDTSGVWGFYRTQKEPVKAVEDDLGIDIELTGTKKTDNLDGMNATFLLATTKESKISEAGEVIETDWLERGIARERITYGDVMDVFDEFSKPQN